MRRCAPPTLYYFLFFKDTATTEIYTLSLHDALPILDSPQMNPSEQEPPYTGDIRSNAEDVALIRRMRSEEHTSELQSRLHLVCRLMLEKKKERTAAPTCLSTTAENRELKAT